MRVVINAQLDPKCSGGIAQVVLGLAHSLGKLDGPEEYVFVCSPESASWLKPYTGLNSHIETNTKRAAPPTNGVRVSDGFWESFSPDVLHFPYQSYTRTNIPSVFNPHDLQHVHLPELFSESERARREQLYGDACRASAAVAAANQFVKDDIIRHYEIPPEKVHIILWGPPSAVYERPTDEEVAQVLSKYRLPGCFAVYPAQTWPHKNHKLLLEALQLLRDRDNVVIPLVCTGAKTEHYAQLAQLVEQWELHSQVRFLGWISERELMALYRAAEMMIVPTLFEGFGLPVFEAFAEGIPVACSAVTSLPEQTGGATLLVDPNDVEELASAILRLRDDEALRRVLIERGKERLAHFSWGKTAEEYRALYHRVAGQRDRAHAIARIAMK